MTLFALVGAFVPSLASPDIQAMVNVTADKAVQAMPSFKRKWWYRADRLDARPTIWSLENRPEEWEVCGRLLPDYVKHKPSDHYYSEYGTMFANCDCSRLEFQRGQQKRLAKAVKAFISRQAIITQHQYQNHFLGQ